jgi:hypothetical protein
MLTPSGTCHLVSFDQIVFFKSAHVRIFVIATVARRRRRHKMIVHYCTFVRKTCSIHTVIAQARTSTHLKCLHR